jgi:hypothetical protein
MNEVANEPETATGLASTPARLARLVDTLRRRDWLGIGIELAVVTLGVLLAFQIDQWGDRRKQAQEERQFMEQLYADARVGADELRPILETHRKFLREAGQALLAQGDSGKIAALPHGLGFGCGLPGFAPAPYNDTAYADIVQSGRLGLLSDLALRTAVRDLAASQLLGATEVASSRQQLPIFLTALDPYYRVSIDRKFQPLCHIDWSQLLGDQRAVNAIARGVRRHLQVLQARERTYQQTLRVEQMLACKLNKPECRQMS